MTAKLLPDDTYRKEYTKDFVSCRDDIIGWDGREESEADFFHCLLNACGVEDILDDAAGTGFHSIVLAKDGFRVDAANAGRIGRVCFIARK